MPELIAVVVLGLLAAVVFGPVFAIVALVRANRLQDSVRRLAADLQQVEVRLDVLARAVRDRGAVSGAEDAAAAPSVPAAPPASARPAEPLPAPVSRPAAVPPPLPAMTVPRAPTAPPRAPAPVRSRSDFATNLGPRILVAGGALAFVVFLGLFVKYAWDNNWVGPTGRVLSGAAFGVALLAAGVRLMDRRYRPLGQGLAAAGVAGLYTSAFGAHAFYDLIGRGPAGVWMLAITASAVLLAARLDARLLAALAWTGGYMTPALLSTGEDRALSLYAFLLLLGAGALVLDHQKPWPETAPIALGGTFLLYAGWFERFFRPERFDVAALGVVLFTSLFALGMARKERALGLAAVFTLASLGLAALAAGADRPGMLLLMSLALGAAALHASARLGAGFVALGGVVVGLPFLAWAGSHYRPDAVGIAAAWIVFTLLGVTVALLRLPPREAAVPAALEALAFLAAGLVSVALCAATDRPDRLLAFLLAQGGVAVLARRRWEWAEVLGLAGGALSVLAWTARFHDARRTDDALMLAVPVGGLYALAVIVRGLLLRRPLVSADVAVHVGAASFLWVALFTILDAAASPLLGVVAAGLAAAYLACGLAALRAVPSDAVQSRVLLGLAATFLTIAIPVQLGLHAITVAWAAEGALLVALGVRFASPLTRAGGYAVLGLSVLRLLARHLPLHDGPFVPVLNPSFGAWLFVIGALAVAVRLTRPVEAGDLEEAVRPLLGGTAFLLLFALLTAETRASFGQAATDALRAGERAAHQSALRAQGLAVSVLWTVFATSLLAAGLGWRNRPLFYTAYGLFAVTAGKVVFVDLGTFSTPYRMVSFLALALLLMAGAYLNLRFRERLAPGGAAE